MEEVTFVSRTKCTPAQEEQTRSCGDNDYHVTQGEKPELRHAATLAHDQPNSPQ
jgi:hypothetical protein